MGEKSVTSGLAPVKLVRRLTLPLLVLYGLGVTIGAGIYVLVGLTAAKAGIYAPISFVLAAFAVAFTGLSYCEMATRFPVSAGEAAYVREGFNSKKMSLLIGLMVAASGIVSSATVSLGAVAYLQAFIPISTGILTALVIGVIGLVAIWGILESVALAAFFTLIEIGGLGLVMYYAIYDNPGLWADIPMVLPPFELGAWAGISSACLLAFFAFVGFEDIANIAEEVKNPSRTLPRGIILTLIISTLIYVAVVTVTVLVVPIDILSTSSAPLSLVFVNASAQTKMIFALIAIFATLNGVLIQVIMSSRVIYGLSIQKNLPAFLSHVNTVTHTPVKATVLVIGIILFFAYFMPISDLAEATSRIVLIIFVFVNLALLRLKWNEIPTPENAFQTHASIPVIGIIISGLLLVSEFWAS